MLDDFDMPSPRRVALTASDSTASDARPLDFTDRSSVVPTPLLAWWREHPALTPADVDALVRLFPALDAVVTAFAETTLGVLEGLGPLPTDLLAVAVVDAREEIKRSPCAAWAVPGARALSLAYLGAEPDGRLQLALGVDAHDGLGSPGEELAGPVPPSGERRWRGAVEKVLDAVRSNDSEIPMGTRVKARLGLVWRCGDESRVLALCGGDRAQRLQAERAVNGATSAEQALQRFMEGTGAFDTGANEPVAPAGAHGPSPLHRWTWQRVLIFAVLVALSAWAYLGDT